MNLDWIVIQQKTFCLKFNINDINYKRSNSDIIDDIK